eukprot:1187399-Prorocentrum_minimum.AAC.1
MSGAGGVWDGGPGPPRERRRAQDVGGRRHRGGVHRGRGGEGLPGPQQSVHRAGTRREGRAGESGAEVNTTRIHERLPKCRKRA